MMSRLSCHLGHPRSLAVKVSTPISTFYHLPPGFLSFRKEEPLSELFPQKPVSGYSWPCRTQVADKVVSPSFFRSSLPPCPFSWFPLCQSFSPSVVVESCNVSRPSMYSLLDNVDDVIYICLVWYLILLYRVTRIRSEFPTRQIHFKPCQCWLVREK